VVKMLRVALLAVVVLGVTLAFRGAAHDESAQAPGSPAAKQPLLPWFLWRFIAMVGVNSMGVIPVPVTDVLNAVSRACLVTAIAALGLKTSVAQLARAGWLPMLLIGAETLWLALFVGAALTFMR
jgi:uncharacterized membrane protein YadS